MKTKAKIVERLIEEKHITAEEAVMLLKETSLAVNGFMDLGSKPVRTDGKVPYHEICGCDVCHCIMANKMVDLNHSGNWSTDFTYTTSDINDGINGNGETQQEYYGKK